jgi:hypothetical protein
MEGLTLSTSQYKTASLNKSSCKKESLLGAVDSMVPLRRKMLYYSIPLIPTTA